ncbi:MAG: histidine phosphatase family protein [Chloroflexota bacterium]|nr:histidine phosphatase family protein [Chloroflexota bacterium]
MDLYLVRHGLSTWNLAGRWQGGSDPELAREGRRQAVATAAFFAAHAIWEKVRITALYSSPLQRAWHTARHLGQALALDPQPVEGLREMAGGVVEGLTEAEQQARYPQLLTAWQNPDDPDFGWPGGETRRVFAARCIRTLTTICARHAPDDGLIVVTHGGVIQAYLSGAGLDDPAGSLSYEADNCGITHIHFAATPTVNGPPPATVGCVMMFNHRAHLPPVAAPAPRRPGLAVIR